MNAPSVGPLGRRGDNCVSDLTLDQWIAGELARTPARVATVEKHLAECARCSGRAESLRGTQAGVPGLAPSLGLAGDNVLKSLPPLGGSRPVRQSGLRRYVPVMALAAAVLLTVYLGTRRTLPAGEDALRTKGGAALTVYVRDPDGHTAPLASDVPLAGGSRLRFQVSSPQAAYVLLLGLDSAGHVSLYAPTSVNAEPPQLTAREQRLLEGSIELDDTPGSERLFALFCPSRPNAQHVMEVAQTALTASQNQPERLQVLGLSCLERTALIKKAAGSTR